MKKKVRKSAQSLKLKNLLTLLVSGTVNAFGVTMFLTPVGLYDSGISGTSMLLGQLTPPWLTLSVFLVVLNVPLFLYGLKKQGFAFTVYSIFAVCVYAATAWLIQDVLPISVANTSPFAGSDLLLCAIFGGIISGIGSGTTLRFGGAIDGMEVLAVIFSHSLNITVGTFVMVYNAALYIVAGILMGSWVLPLYSILTYMAGIKAVDFIVEGLDKTKAAMIITNHPQEICKELSAAFGTGITLMDAHGYYSNESKTIVYFVVNRFQIARMRAIVQDIDDNAFISITEVSDLFGKSAK